MVYTAKLIASGLAIATRLLTAVLFLSFSVSAYLIVNDAAFAQEKFESKQSKTQKLQYIPKFEIKTLGGDFERWETAKTINKSENIQLRWGFPLFGSELQTKLFKDNTLLETTTISNFTTVPGVQKNKWFWFNANLKKHLPSNPPNAPQKYRLEAQAYKQGQPYGLKKSVIITQMKNNSSTSFTEEGLNTEIYNETLFQPKRFFVNFSNFKIELADEPGEEEPYFIPLVIVFDGTKLLVNSLADSEVRLLNKGGVHNNIPRYNDSLTHGSSVGIPSDTGYYEFNLLPIGIREFNGPPPGISGGVSLNTLGVTLPDLLKGTFIWVAALALEEDSTLDHAAVAMRDALVSEMRKELNECLQSLTMLDALVIAGSPNPKTAVEELNCFTEEEYNELELKTPYAEATYKDYLIAYLKSFGKSAALGEELDEARLWMPGGNVFQLITLADHDEVVGFSDSFKTMHEIMFWGKPVNFNLSFIQREKLDEEEKIANPKLKGKPQIIYHITGQIGQCNTNQPSGEKCVPYIHPSWKLGKKPYQ